MYRLTKCCAVAAIFLAVCCGNIAVADEHFDTLSVAGQSYSNVTVMTKTAKHVSFKHSKGFASVKVADMSQDLQIQLGYAPPPPPKKPLDFTKDLTKDWTKGYQFDPRLQQIQEQIKKEVERLIDERNPVFVYGSLGGLAFAYLFFCFTAMLICKKTGYKPGIVVWIPVFQFIPILKAAGMSGWCFFLLFVPVINILVVIVWCFKICRTRGKSLALGFMLLLPLLNLMAWLYLAFSDGGGKEDEPSQPKKKKDSGKLRLSYQN